MPTVLITGASRGLGLEFARQYAADGWTVYATCRDKNRAGRLIEAAAAANGNLHVVEMDVDNKWPTVSRPLPSTC
jgi:NAD(P)-dependent dehydrogenase (short-subunit alcohol dehydrogenase family)